MQTCKIQEPRSWTKMADKKPNTCAELHGIYTKNIVMEICIYWFSVWVVPCEGMDLIHVRVYFFAKDKSIMQEHRVIVYSLFT